MLDHRSCFRVRTSHLFLFIHRGVCLDLGLGGAARRPQSTSLPCECIPPGFVQHVVLWPCSPGDGHVVSITLPSLRRTPMLLSDFAVPVDVVLMGAPLHGLWRGLLALVKLRVRGWIVGVVHHITSYIGFRRLLRPSHCCFAPDWPVWVFLFQHFKA